MGLTSNKPSDFYIGLMSGTSLDGVDGVILDFSVAPLRIAAYASASMPAVLHKDLLELQTPGHNELHRASLAAHGLARLYAQVVADLLEQTGLSPDQIQAIGAHGQTVRHRPDLPGGQAYTLQLNQAASLAEWTGIGVVADFRSRDLAAGGQGAPLVPAFHRHLVGDQGGGAFINIGGMANVSLMWPDGRTLGFDTGPGNVFLDAWWQSHHEGHCDLGGRWAAQGQVLPGLLKVLLSETYFSLPPPKSTGRDLFNPDWLQDRLRVFESAQQLAGQACSSPADIQATLCAFTSASILDALKTHAPDIRQAWICGGGALNDTLMQSMRQGFEGDLQSTASLGIPPMQMEAAAFAWLARAFVRAEPANLPAVTGARGPRRLGAWYPAR